MNPIAAARRLIRRVGHVWREGRSDALMHAAGYGAWRARMAEMGVPDVAGLRVLEIGCGDRAQLSLLLAADGATVTAIDPLPVALGTRRPRMWLSTGRSRGLRAALRVVARDLLHTFRYWMTMARESQRRLPFTAVKIVQGSAESMPFGDETFDLIVSSAVWEHVMDVPAATAETNRVLAPDGLAVIQIALFPALQGGHHADWHSVDPERPREIRPWDHLLPGRRRPPTQLNEWREAQYRAVFDREMDVVEWSAGERRGEEYLRPEIEAALPEYSRRDLLLADVTVWARKRTSRRT